MARKKPTMVKEEACIADAVENARPFDRVNHDANCGELP